MGTRKSMSLTLVKKYDVKDFCNLTKKYNVRGGQNYGDGNRGVEIAIKGYGEEENEEMFYDFIKFAQSYGIDCDDDGCPAQFDFAFYGVVIFDEEFLQDIKMAWKAFKRHIRENKHAREDKKAIELYHSKTLPEKLQKAVDDCTLQGDDPDIYAAIIKIFPDIDMSGDEIEALYNYIADYTVSNETQSTNEQIDLLYAKGYLANDGIAENEMNEVVQSFLDCSTPMLEPKSIQKSVDSNHVSTWRKSMLELEPMPAEAETLLEGDIDWDALGDNNVKRLLEDENFRNLYCHPIDKDCESCGNPFSVILAPNVTVENAEVLHAGIKGCKECDDGKFGIESKQ